MTPDPPDLYRFQKTTLHIVLKITYSFALYIILSLPGLCYAQKDSRHEDIDLLDIYREVFKQEPPRYTNEGSSKEKVNFTILPAAGYTLQTGGAALLSANATFHTTPDTTDNLSTVTSSLTYTQYQQIILPVQTYIWTNKNRYNIVTDWRFMKYPSFTYGLGGHTTEADQYRIDYSTVHLYQTAFRNIGKGLYAGIGYNFDYYWNIKEVDPPVNERTDYAIYENGVKSKVVASGITLNMLYDSRKNPINPNRGSFARVTYRPNFTFLGSDANWQSMIFDLRHYFQFPGSSKNVLAFWNYDWFTAGGNPPYLMLPSTGWDPNSNLGRGYIQGRFRGRNLLYLEGEYRFRITNNGLIGGVVFANAQSVSEQNTNRFEVIAPGWGGGVRIKINKFSNTNVAVDYSFGLGGSKGFFVNLGEVF